MATGTYTPSVTDVVHVAEVDIVTRQMLSDPIHLVQYDQNLPILEVKLWKDNEEYVIPSGAIVNIRLEKPDSTYVYNEAIGLDSTRKLAYVKVTQQMASVHGRVSAIIELRVDGKIAGSSPIDIVVDRNPVQEGAIESSSEFKTLEQYVKDAGVSADKAKESETNAKRSETNAKDSENKSKISETNAKDSETKAKASELAAQDSEDAAFESETKAKTSELAAKDSETKAKASELAAQDSEDAALASQNAAKVSENAAKASQNAAKTSEDNALGSKNAAANSAAAAKASELLSKTSETNAKNSENAANASQNAAATSASNANNYATAAESFAHGGTGTRNGEDQDNAEHYYEQVKEMAERLSNALIAKGTITFAELMAITDAQPGDQYNISDEFVTTNAFREGAGITVPLGSNVYMTEDGYWDVLAGSPVASVNGETGNVEITPENIGAFPGVTVVKQIDINELYDPGIYFLNSCTVGGESINNCWLMVMTSSTLNSSTAGYAIKQLRWGYSSSLDNAANHYMSMRILTPSGWSGFKRFAMYDDVILKSSDAGQWVEDMSTMSAGSASQPVYFNDGVPTPIDDTLLLLTIEKLHNYWGLKINGTPNDWLRVPSSGIIPYGQSTNGYSAVGSSQWPFAEIHGKKLYGTVQWTEWNSSKYAGAGNLVNGMFWVDGSVIRNFSPSLANFFDDTGAYVIKMRHMDSEQTLIIFNPKTNSVYITSKYGTTNAFFDWKQLATTDVMTGATAVTAGKSGLVPAPAAGSQNRYLRANGTWDTPKIYQEFTSLDKKLPVLLKYLEGDVNSVDYAKYSPFVYVNPAKKDLVAEHIRTESIGNMKGSNGIFFPFVSNSLYIGHSDHVGAIKVKFPEFLTNVTTFKLSIYDYRPGTVGSQMADYLVSFYPFLTEEGPKVVNGLCAYSVSKSATDSIANLPVRFGRDSGDGAPVVLIGWLTSVWEHPKVYLHDLTFNTLNTSNIGETYQKLKDGITISITNSPSFIEDAVIENPNIKAGVMLAKKGTNGYFGLVSPDGTEVSYIRTPTEGILPNAPSTSGVSHIGSSSWPFIDVYAKTFYGELFGKLRGGVIGTYSGSGGKQPPSFIESGNVKFAMMNGFSGTSSELIGYMDCLLMDTYNGNDVPWVTAFGITKSENPFAYIATGQKGNTTTWNSVRRLYTANGGLIYGSVVIDSVDHGIYLLQNNAVYIKASSINGVTLRVNSSASTIEGGVWLQTFNTWARFRPNSDGTHDIGSSDFRFKQIYATTSAISTSDRRLKKNISELPDELTKKFILGLIACSYQLIDGESGRYHWGFTSQQIEELMLLVGMDSKNFAGFIKSPKTREVEVETEVEVDEEYIDEETGEMKTRKVKKIEKRIEQEIIPGEYIYSLRYEEFIAPTVKVVQMLAKENEEQQEEIDELKEIVESQQEEINDLKTQNENLQQQINELREMVLSLNNRIGY